MKSAVGNYAGRIVRVDQNVWTLARDNKTVWPTTNSASTLVQKKDRF